jgi:Glycosyltransferases involved in cell wall biogenesis
MVLLTVVLASHNYACFLPQALEAVVQQLDERMRLLVIDDASTDESPAIIEGFMHRCPQLIFVRNEVNLGLHATVNKGLKMAEGRYICFAAADDRILPGMLSQSVELLETHPAAAFCTSPVEYMDESGTICAHWPGPQLPDSAYLAPVDAARLMRCHGFWFVTGGSVFRLDRYREAGGYDPELGHLADSFLSQTLALHHGFCSLSRPMAHVRVLAGSYSGTERSRLEDSHRVRAAAIKCMRQMPDLYPESFIRDWDELWGMLDALQAWKQTVLCRQREFLGRGITLYRTKRSWPDRIFPSLLRFMSLVQFLVLGGWGLLLLADNPLLRPYLKWPRLRPWLKKHIRG